MTSKLESLKRELRGALAEGSSIYDSPSSLMIYSRDQGEVPKKVKDLLLSRSTPHLVVQPASEEDVIKTIEFARGRGVPIIPRGAATFALGGAVPTKGGIVVDLSALRRIKGIDFEERIITVTAGTRWADLDQALAGVGLALKAYPTSWFSTVGGWIATGGYGIGSTAFGHLKGQIEALEVITPRGEVEELRAEDPRLSYFVGTEGQMGLIWEVTLRVSERGEGIFPVLLQFKSEEEAFNCAEEVLRGGPTPYHMKFTNANRMKEINEFLGKHLVEERCGLLLTFTSRDEERAHRSETATIGLPISEAYQAHYLWHERFFPLRAKRLSPGLLGAEVILPLERASDYLARAKALGGNFGVQISSEAHFLDGGNVLVISSYRFDPRSEISELFQAALALLLTKTGIDMGGCPYGIGIWNTPFLRYKHNRKTVKDLQRFKMEVAPDSVFNPGKFFSPPPGICGQLFRPLPLKMGLGALNFMAPAHRWFDSRGSVDGKGDLIRETISSCSGCGSCVPVCPAYLYTKDERTTARGKLWLASKLGDGRLSPEEAQAFFLCMHCDACTDVCQSGLRLKPVWEELESRIEAEFGKDEDRIRKFVEGVEGSGIMEEMLHGEQQI